MRFQSIVRFAVLPLLVAILVACDRKVASQDQPVVAGTDGVYLVDCHVSPATEAMISSSADGIDVLQSRDIVIEKCVLVVTADDATSFLNHGHGDNGQLFETRFGSPYPDTNEGVTIRDNLIEGGNRNAIILLAFRAEISGNTLRHTRQYGIKFGGDDTRISNNRLTELRSFAAYRHITDELDTRSGKQVLECDKDRRCGTPERRLKPDSLEAVI
jgi:nitrous oxidase accessory protein NosD